MSDNHQLIAQRNYIVFRRSFTWFRSTCSQQIDFTVRVPVQCAHTMATAPTKLNDVHVAVIDWAELEKKLQRNRKKRKMRTRRKKLCNVLDRSLCVVHILRSIAAGCAEHRIFVSYAFRWSLDFVFYLKLIARHHKIAYGIRFFSQIRSFQFMCGFGYFVYFSLISFFLCVVLCVHGDLRTTL